MTAVSPSRTSIVVLASFFKIVGSPRAPVLTKSGSFLVTLIVSMTVPSLVTCGLTARLNLASTNCVWAPIALTTDTGIDTPCSITASMLSMVVMRGEDKMRTVPVDSMAERRRFKLKAPATDPMVRPMALPVARPAGAGMLTTKFGLAPPATPVRTPGTRPDSGELPSSAPPPMPTL